MNSAGIDRRRGTTWSKRDADKKRLLLLGCTTLVLALLVCLGFVHQTTTGGTSLHRRPKLTAFSNALKMSNIAQVKTDAVRMNNHSDSGESIDEKGDDKEGVNDAVQFDDDIQKETGRTVVCMCVLFLLCDYLGKLNRCASFYSTGEHHQHAHVHERVDSKEESSESAEE
jgi:hypothetical protein